MWAFGPGELLQTDVRFSSEKYIAIRQALVRSVRAMAILPPQPIKVVVKP